MEQTAKGSLEVESQPPKPALKPKPALVAHGAKAHGVGWQTTTRVQGARAPLPTKRRSSDALPAAALGNVRKIREWFDRAPEAAAVAKRSLGVRRSVSAREALKGPAPVPKARRKRLVRSEAVAEVLANRREGRAPALPTGELVGVPDRQDLSVDRQEGADIPVGEESAWHCPISCPCLCHMSRPGMALVWRPVPGAESGPDVSEVSLSHTMESNDKSSSDELPICDPEEKQEAANHSLDLCLPEISPDDAGAEGKDPVRHHTIQPVVVSQGGDRAVSQPDGNHQFTSAPESGALQPHQEPSAKPVLKPPRRNKPVGQSSLDSAPEVSARGLSRDWQPAAAPSHILERYTASDLDKFSKSVDQLNLRIQKLELPDQRTLPSLGPEAMLKPPSPKVTRSAPPSPKEKYLHPVYIEMDLGAEVNSRSNKCELPLAVPWSRSSKPETQNVNDWESRFESQPLYQTYRDAVIHKEIKRQTLIRDSSKTSADYMYEIIPLVPDGENAGSSLWQNLSAVQQSGILDGLSQEERRRQESMFEVLTSEASYLRSLNILIDHFMNSRDLNDAIILLDKKALFSCIVRVKEVSDSFLKDLAERVDMSIKITDVCDIIYSHARHNFQVYIDYVRNQIYQEQKYTQLMETNPQFAAAIVRLQEHPQCQRLPLMSFLLLPFQRITRVKMLIENILQRSEVGSANEASALKALGVVSKIIEDCNREVGIMKQMEEMIHIAKKLEFDKLKAIPIISQLRHLEKQGELSEIILRGNLFGLKAKVNLLYFFLFNDLLLITTKKSGDRYQVVDYSHRSLVEVRECSDKSLQATIGNCFQLMLLENHQGKQCERLLKTLTESDCHRWMNALTSGNSSLQDDDKIYECWDCPQVQCIIPYTALQADELSLEPADIINVTKKSSEGWYEGSKLSSGQKGWFPSDHVQEITNEHVRRRNLRERSRLLQAAQQLQGKPDGARQEKSTASL